MTRRRAGRVAGAVPQRPFGPVVRRVAPVEVLSGDEVAAIHGAALRVLAEVGMRVLSDRAVALYRAAGAEVRDGTVRFDPAMIAERLRTVPAHFRLEARDPALSLEFGGGHVVFASVGGPAL